MLIKVKVFPNSKKQEIIKRAKDSFDVKVKAKPIKGQANREVIKALASFLKIPESRIRMIKGFKQRNKVFEILKSVDLVFLTG
ncbi:DUF167 domain-containing protein [Candidatus Parcubacteria bacterium]|nr:DUF167 domain-containing protein [Candidatus Parcubacteria bacterium]